MRDQNRPVFHSYRTAMLSCIIPLIVFFVGIYGVTGFELYRGYQIKSKGIPVTCTVGYGNSTIDQVIVHYPKDDDSMVTYQVGDTFYGCGVSAYVGEEGNTVELRYLPDKPERVYDYEHELGVGKMLFAIATYILIMCVIAWIATGVVLKRKRNRRG